MKTTKEMMEVMQAYCDGALIEACFTDDKEWWVPSEPSWNWEAYNFRVKDLYAELKLAAKDPTKQIRIKGGLWIDSGLNWNWGNKPEDYEIRDKPKAMKQIKLLAWYDTMDGDLVWRHEGYIISSTYKRAPMQDKVIEVEE